MNAASARSSPAPSSRGFVRSVLVSITEACHVGCAHCGFNGSARDAEASGPEIADWVRQAAAHGVEEVTFTGGEPFERLGELALSMRAAAEAGARTGVFTSSFWATSRERAAAMLGELGRFEVLFCSSDIFHQRRVPADFVRNAIAAALEQQIDVCICITYSSDADLDATRALYAEFGDRVRYHAERLIPTTLISPDRVLRRKSGRKLDPDGYSKECYLHTPLINPTGEVFACHIGKAAAHETMRGSPYYLGDLRHERFGDIFDAAWSRPDYQYLHAYGPRGVARAVNGSPLLAQEMSRTEFSSACDMCQSALRRPSGGAALRERSSLPKIREHVLINHLERIIT